MRKAFTANNFATFITGGGGGTLNSRKNGANGNITANLNVGSAQLVQDTTHSDNLAVGDDFDWQFSDTGINYSYDFYACDFTSTNGDCIFACATDDPVMSINTSVTAYYWLAGSLDTSQSTETNAQVTVNNAFKFSQLTCKICLKLKKDLHCHLFYFFLAAFTGFFAFDDDDQIITIAQDSEINNNIKLRYEPSEDVILIHADRIRLTQVISNILSNAVKFTNKGTISITIKKENDKAIVGIQDTSLGIDAEIMSRLFSKFAAKSDIGGIGLGLFISKSVIEAHGGTISAKNNEDGKRGATFTFSLPLTK